MKLEKCKSLNQVLIWLEDSVRDIHPAFGEAIRRAYQLGLVKADEIVCGAEPQDYGLLSGADLLDKIRKESSNG